MKYTIYICFAFLLSGIAVMAQGGTCPEIVTTAINTTANACENLNRNRICYGNLQIETQFQEGTPNFIFEQAGDVVDIAVIDTLNLSAMTSPDKWGVALLAIQANLPDSIPGQNVTMVLFGDVAVQNMGAPQPPSIDLVLPRNVNVRSNPFSNALVVGGVVRGETTALIGQTAAGDWLQVRLPELQQTGWFYAEPGSLGIDTSSLNIVDPNSPAASSVFAPMSAFFFTSGVVQPQCTEAPRDGMLIQTPSDMGEVSLMANGVLIEMGSTVLIRAVPGDVMNVILLEGSAKVTVNGSFIIIPPGAQAQIPLDGEGMANGVPALLPINAAMIQSLPLALLPETITVARPITEIRPFGTSDSGSNATDVPLSTVEPDDGDDGYGSHDYGDDDYGDDDYDGYGSADYGGYGDD